MFDGFLDLLEDGIRWLFYWLSTMIYDLIIWIYEIFLKLCNSRILDADLIEALSKRIGLILGLVMLFMVIVSAIQMLIDPDKITDKEKGAGNIVKKIIIVIIMLGVSNSAFRALYGIQKIVIDSNILGKILVPYEVETDKFGGVLSAELFTAFYHFNPEIDPESEKECYDYSEFLKSDIIQKKGFDNGYECLTTRNSDDKYVMNFNALLSPIVGIAAIYFLFGYTITIGIRTIQLAFLEIISPMAIISYLSLKKDTMFDKWWKLYFSTYTDVFIRILIINFVVFLISLVFATEGSIVFWDSIGGKTGDFWIDTYITVIIVIALLMFAKKAPELLKNIFPSSGGSGLGFGGMTPKKMFNDMLGGGLVKTGLIGATGLGIGAAIGGAGNAIRRGFDKENGGWKSALAGFGGGLLSGGLAGAKAKGVGKAFGASNKAAMAQNKRIADWRAAGGTSTWSRWGTGLQQRFGIKTEADKLDLEKTNIETENAAYKAYDGYIDAAEKRAESQILKGAFKGNSHAEEALRQQKLAEIYTQQSANIKRSDFIDKETGYFNEKGYTDALDELADKAAKANSLYLTEMKAAKKDYISEQLRIAREKGIDSADAPTIQNMQQAASVIDANEQNKDYAFVDENRNRVKGDNLLAGDYDSFDKVNSNAKAKASENNIKLEKDRVEGKSSRADAKYSGVDKK